MRQSWVHAVWAASLVDNVLATNERFSEHEFTLTAPEQVAGRMMDSKYQLSRF